MEEEGLIQSRLGAKSCMVLGADTVERIRRELLENDIRGMVSAMRQMGLTKAEALSWIEQYWDGEEVK